MNSLAEILSSKTRAEIFAVFFNSLDEELHFRDIQRRINQSVGATKQELEKLVSLDLLKIRKSGNRVYYKANRENPLYKPIYDLVQRTSGIISLLKKNLSNQNIDFAFIFGSYARDEITSESDIDLFVIGNLNSKKLSSLVKATSIKISREINYFIILKEEFIDRKKRSEHFITSIIKSPKVFIIGEENDFTEMGNQ